MTRKAVLGDVPALFEMIHHYVAQRIMLPRTLPDLYENIWEFTVVENEGIVAGCGALKFYNAELAEIRSLCVAPGQEKHGIGRLILERLLEEAEGYGLKTVFAMTMAQGFFAKQGFREVERDMLPMKIWRDCLRCDRHICCTEIAMVLDLESRQRAHTDTESEPAELRV